MNNREYIFDDSLVRPRAGTCSGDSQRNKTLSVSHLITSDFRLASTLSSTSSPEDQQPGFFDMQLFAMKIEGFANL